ncbi:MAG: exodeoxyribonuclease VII small subunit [Chitinispirillia bacterium]
MAKKEETFESAIKKLEGIIADLENNELNLENALKSFEEGVVLMRTCERHLKNTEGKLTELFKGENGEFIEKTLGISLHSVINGDDFDG